MNLEVHHDCEPKKWDATVRSLESGPAHSSAWARYINVRDLGVTPCYVLLVSEAGDIEGAALGFRQRSRYPLMARLTRRFWTCSVPLVQPGFQGGLSEFLYHLEGYAKRCGDTEIEIGSSGSGYGRKELQGAGFDLVERLEFELHLNRSDEELLGRMEPQRRNKLRKAARNGVAVHDHSNEYGIAELRRLQGDSSERIVARGGRQIGLQRRKKEDPIGVLLKTGLARIVCAEVNGRIVSAGLFTHFNGLVYYALSGHSREGLKTQAPTLLLWETLKRYRQEGAKRLNLGGCKADAVEVDSSEHGLYQYKKAFGGDRIQCASGRKSLRKNHQRIARWLRTLARQ